MTDNHSYSFFGQSTGVIFQSGRKEDPYVFLRCIKKKPNQAWEKPSLGEGKAIRCSLEEMVMILQVLKKESQSWSSYHKYKGENTQIGFNWEGQDMKKLWINIGTYSKMLNVAQVEIFRLMLTHIIEEKVEFGTVSSFSKSQHSGDSSPSQLNHASVNDNKTNNSEGTMIVESTTVKEETSQGQKAKYDTEGEKVSIMGAIKSETQKALFITFNSGQEVWIPKSTIHSEFKPELGVPQNFLMDAWILKRNKVIS